jgi:ketosteroid isomerase-like protein
MKIAVRVLFAVAFAALATRPATAQIDTSTDEGQISQALRNVRIAFASGDIDGALKFYWNDPKLTVIDPDEGIRLNGWNEYKSWLSERATVQKTLLWRAHQRKLHVKGDNAFVTFLVTRQVQMGNTVQQKNERGTYVLKKMDGKWLVVAQHISAWPKMLLFQQTK